MTRTSEPAHPATVSYGSYLRLPELLACQSPATGEHDELLFVIIHQVYELWFKQILHELAAVIPLLDAGALPEATRLLARANRIFAVLGAEVGVLATMPPREFARFRGVLSTSSGFESEQFRELELASGLADRTFRSLIAKHMDGPALQARWPRTLVDAFAGVLAAVVPDPVAAVLAIYRAPERHAAAFYLAEVLTAYDQQFQEWRFHHLQLVERVIGDRMPGTAGSAGSGYLGKTLGYRLFPVLWEARNRFTAQGPPGR